MTEKEEVLFAEGDIVLTKEDEKDIELIPAGTVIKLRRLTGDDLWEGTAKIKGIPRSVLVYEDNLRHAF